MTVPVENEPQNPDTQNVTRATQQRSHSPARVVVSWDVIHLIYNLFYPAVMGAFIYELLTFVLPIGHRLLPRLVPEATERNISADSIFALTSLAVVFSVDFLLAKKLYVLFGRKFDKHVGWLALMESMLVIVIALAFASCHETGVAWPLYFFWLLWAVLLFNLFYVVMGKALGRPSIDKSIERALKWTLGGMAISCLSGLVVSSWTNLHWPLILLSILTALFAIAYFSISTRKTSINYPLSISGSNLNDSA